jgi:hypothetical protein
MAIITKSLNIYALLYNFLKNWRNIDLIIVNFILLLKINDKFVSELPLDSARFDELLLCVKYGYLVCV